MHDCLHLIYSFDQCHAIFSYLFFQLPPRLLRLALTVCVLVAFLACTDAQIKRRIRRPSVASGDSKNAAATVETPIEAEESQKSETSTVVSTSSRSSSRRVPIKKSPSSRNAITKLKQQAQDRSDQAGASSSSSSRFRVRNKTRAGAAAAVAAGTAVAASKKKTATVDSDGYKVSMVRQWFQLVTLLLHYRLSVITQIGHNIVRKSENTCPKISPQIYVRILFSPLAG